MKKTGLGIIVLLVFAISLALGGCATTFKADNGKLAYAEIKGESKGKFEARVNHFSILSPYWFPLDHNNEKLNTIIDPELARLDANAATDIQIKSGFDALGYVVTYLTGGFLRWEYVSVTGNAVKK